MRRNSMGRFGGRIQHQITCPETDLHPGLFFHGREAYDSWVWEFPCSTISDGVFGGITVVFTEMICVFGVWFIINYFLYSLHLCMLFGIELLLMLFYIHLSRVVCHYDLSFIFIYVFVSEVYGLMGSLCVY